LSIPQGRNGSEGSVTKEIAMDEFIKIAALESTIEAQLAESILEERSIPHRIRSFHDTAYDGLFQLQRGWGELLAPEGFRDDIEEILESLRSARTPEDG
jgi:hypothetical protein